MFTFIGILLLLFTLVMVFIHPTLQKEKTGYKQKSPEFLLMWGGSNRLKLVLVGLLFIVVGISTIFTKEGHQYYVLSPTGHRSSIMTPGVKFIVPFSKIQEWSKYIDVKGIPVDENGELLESSDGIEGVIPGGVKVMFIDRAMANVYLSVRFELPNDEVSFIKLV